MKPAALSSKISGGFHIFQAHGFFQIMVAPGAKISCVGR
jgi:hypothetical protein